MLFSFAFGINEDVIKIHYHKDIELLCQGLVDIALESGRYFGQSKRYHLVLKVAIAGFEGYFSFIVFFDPHLIIDIG